MSSIKKLVYLMMVCIGNAQSCLFGLKGMTTSLTKRNFTPLYPNITFEMNALSTLACVLVQVIALELIFEYPLPMYLSFP